MTNHSYDREELLRKIMIQERQEADERVAFWREGAEHCKRMLIQMVLLGTLAGGALGLFLGYHWGFEAAFSKAGWKKATPR